MWFDARAALARMEGGAHPAPEALDRLNLQPPATQHRYPTARPAPAQFAEFAGFATPRRSSRAFAECGGNPVSMTEVARRRAADLPSTPLGLRGLRGG